jgi:hypothetical protein
MEQQMKAVIGVEIFRKHCVDVTYAADDKRAAQIGAERRR